MFIRAQRYEKNFIYAKKVCFFSKTIKKTRAPVSTREKRYNGVAYPLRRTGGRYVWIWSFSPGERKKNKPSLARYL